MLTLWAALVFGEVYTTIADGVLQPNLAMTAKPGETATLKCNFSTNKPRSILWFKHTFAQKPLYIGGLYMNPTDYSYSKDFKDYDRFEMQEDQGIFNLRVSKVTPSDSAMYYCAIFLQREVTFGGGTFLIVEESQSNRLAVVHQPLSVQPGDSVSLQCTIHTETCAGEHSVHWFRQGSRESSPGIIYNHGSRSGQCERSSGAPTQSCVYNLTKKNLSLFDSGTYYCTVATCGEILFGNGTNLNVKGRGCMHVFGPVVLSLGLALALCVAVITGLICTRNKTPHCEHCDGALSQACRSMPDDDRSNPQNSHTDSLHYAALNFSRKKQKAEKRRTEMEGHTVYADVRGRGFE